MRRDPGTKTWLRETRGKGWPRLSPTVIYAVKAGQRLTYADPVLNVKLTDLSNSQCSLLFLLCGFTPASSTSLKRALFFLKWKRDIILRTFVFIYVPKPCVNVCMMYMHVCVYAEACAPGGQCLRPSHLARGRPSSLFALNCIWQANRPWSFQGSPVSGSHLTTEALGLKMYTGTPGVFTHPW